MSKTMIVGDVHLHNFSAFADPTDLPWMNTRAKLILDTIRETLRRAWSEGCESVVFLGDIFETNKPTVQLQRSLSDLFLDFKFFKNIYLMVGNHDRTSGALYDHGLAMMDLVHNVTVVDQPVRHGKLWMVPWLAPKQHGFADAYDWLHGVPCQEPSVLCLHNGLYGAAQQVTVGEGDRNAFDALEVSRLEYICKRQNVQHVLAGHWHAHKHFQTEAIKTMVQLGALMGSSFSDSAPPFQYGVCAIFDDEKDTLSYVIIPGPRFLRGQDSMPYAGDAVEGSRIYVSVKASKSAIPRLRDECLDLLSANTIAGFVIEASPDSLKKEADEVRATISRDSAQDAIEDYIASMAPDPKTAGAASSVAISAWKRV